MKGVVFNVVQQVVEDAVGPEVWDRTLEIANVDGAYTSLGSYDDDDLFKIVGALAELLRLSQHEVLVLAGRQGFPLLASRHDHLLTGMSDWRDVLGHLDHIIHPEVRKIYPDAHVPRFDVRAHGSAVRLGYESDRQLCSLAEGLVRGLGDWFATPLEVEHTVCLRRGDEQCVLEVHQA